MSIVDIVRMQLLHGGSDLDAGLEARKVVFSGANIDDVIQEIVSDIKQLTTKTLAELNSKSKKLENKISKKEIDKNKTVKLSLPATVLELVKAKKLFDYSTKYLSELTDCLENFPLSEAELSKIAEAAVQQHNQTLDKTLVIVRRDELYETLKFKLDDAYINRFKRYSTIFKAPLEFTQKEDKNIIHALNYTQKSDTHLGDAKLITYQEAVNILKNVDMKDIKQIQTELAKIKDVKTPTGIYLADFNDTEHFNLLCNYLNTKKIAASYLFAYYKTRWLMTALELSIDFLDDIVNHEMSKK